MPHFSRPLREVGLFLFRRHESSSSMPSSHSPGRDRLHHKHSHGNCSRGLGRPFLLSHPRGRFDIGVKIPAPSASLRAGSVSPKNGETRTGHPRGPSAHEVPLFIGVPRPSRGLCERAGNLISRAFLFAERQKKSSPDHIVRKEFGGVPTGLISYFIELTPDLRPGLSYAAPSGLGAVG
jgi:hypothetical protein